MNEVTITFSARSAFAYRLRCLKLRNENLDNVSDEIINIQVTSSISIKWLFRIILHVFFILYFTRQYRSQLINTERLCAMFRLNCGWKIFYTFLFSNIFVLFHVFCAFLFSDNTALTCIHHIRYIYILLFSHKTQHRENNKSTKNTGTTIY